jgi:hypothetical protein
VATFANFFCHLSVAGNQYFQWVFA